MIPLDMCVPEAFSEHRPPVLEHTPSTYLHAVTCNIILVYLDYLVFFEHGKPKS